jgi:glyoxylase-like metal-dependent hydrolase (beta-lactamase superfamily II)
MLTRRTLLKSFSAAALVAAVPTLRAQTRSAPTAPDGADAADPLAPDLLKNSLGIRRITPNLAMLLGAGGNIAVLDGPDGALIVDSGTPDNAANTTAALRTITRNPANLLINTHHHFDHAGGNPAVHALGYRIIAHKNAYDLLSRKHEIKFFNMAFEPTPESARPAVTFEQSLTLHANGDTITLTHIPLAHTNNDIIVHFEKAGVLHTGDLFSNGVFPFIDFEVGGSLEGMIAAEEKLLTLVDNSTRIIPGHGPLGSRTDLQAALDMLKRARDLIKPLVDAGKSADETVAAKPLVPLGGKYGHGFLNDDTFVKLVHATYTHKMK